MLLSVHRLTLFLLLILIVGCHPMLANTNHRKNDFSSSIIGEPQVSMESDRLSPADSDSEIIDQQISSNILSKMFHPKMSQYAFDPAVSNFNLRRALISFIPYKKRTIPLELQKALYAHGIVGRRR